MIDQRILAGKTILITGGTGSLGKNLVRRLLTGEMGQPRQIIIFSRDEAKQHAMYLGLRSKKVDHAETVTFRIGDVRSFEDVSSVMRHVDVVINAAALKQVPTCEYHPFDAVRTNIIGAENIVRAIGGASHNTPSMVIGISTDKACKPVNAMGMSKALQERVFLHEGNLRHPETKFMAVRYGNVIASRGSVLPLFHQQITNNQPVTVTTLDMTRFLLTLDQAIDTVFAAIATGNAGELFVPIVSSAVIMDLAKAAISVWNPKHTAGIGVTGIRPGEKIHEILLSEEEINRTRQRNVRRQYDDRYDPYYVIQPSINLGTFSTDLGPRPPQEYSSADHAKDISSDTLANMIRAVDFDAAS